MLYLITHYSHSFKKKKFLSEPVRLSVRASKNCDTITGDEKNAINLIVNNYLIVIGLLVNPSVLR